MRPYILISNDDGYAAGGINFLVDVLRADYDILVVAPEGPRSGFSTAFTSGPPLAVQLVRQEEGLDVYSCSGTPADCVKIALNRYVRRKPDLVVGGINHGDNSSVNSHYSGTIGVVGEAAMQGFPAVAFSLCDHSPKADFTPLRPYVLDMVRRAIEMKMPPFTCWNVNFPLQSTFKGVKICRMAKSRWVKEIVDCPAPRRGSKYYWMAGECEELEPEATDTDRWALAHGYVAVTPTTLDNTDYQQYALLSDCW